MAKKKPTRKKNTAAGNKRAAKKHSPKKKTLNKPIRIKPLAKRKPVRRKRSTAGRKREVPNRLAIRKSRRGLGSAAGGQSGDTQGLSEREDVDSESVEELVEEGQYLEADAISGVEDAKEPDEGEVTTSEVPEDDVPPEYRGRDNST